MSDNEEDSVENPDDLTEPIRAAPKKNQASPSGQKVIIESDGISVEYFYDPVRDRSERFSDILKAELGWIERFTQHGPTVGGHHENILRDLLSEYLPGGLKVGTGFVFDTLRRSCSPQVDIIVYSDSHRSPIYQRGEFVIVDAESVKSICEVKKTLNRKNLLEVLKKYINQNLGTGALHPRNVQSMNIFCFSSSIKTGQIVDAVCKIMTEFFEQFCYKNERDEDVFLSISHMVIPRLYFFDHDKFIRTNMVRENGKSAFEAYVSVLNCHHENGVGEFLSDMNPSYPIKSAYRDLVGQYIHNVHEEKTLEQKFVLMSYMDSSDLIEMFPDAKSEIIENSTEQTKILGINFYSDVNFSKYNSFKSLREGEKLSWRMYDFENKTYILGEV